MKKKQVVGKQQRLFDEKLDPPLVQSADRVIELRKEKLVVKERLEIQERNLVGLMRKANKSKISHGGFIIEITTTSKDRLSVKESKKPKE